MKEYVVEIVKGKAKLLVNALSEDDANRKTVIAIADIVNEYGDLVEGSSSMIETMRNPWWKRWLGVK